MKWCIITWQGTIFFQSSKKKLTKDKVIPIHSAQNWVLDMANFEINFLSNQN